MTTKAGRVPDSELGLAVAFARVARGLGLEVPVGSVITYARSLATLGIDTRSACYWAGRATMVRDPADVDAYDKAFKAFWLGEAEGTAEEPLTGSVNFEGDRELPHREPTVPLHHRQAPRKEPRRFATARPRC